MWLKCLNMQEMVYYITFYSSLIFSVTFQNIIKNTSEFNKSDNKVVRIESGKLEGTIFKTAAGREILAFIGVPYAAPPINEFRFKEPQPLVPWVGTRKTNETIKKCSQMIHHKMVLNKEYISGEEDCLYLNVFTPNLHKDNTTKLLDVVVYIHGGAFMYGSAHCYSPKYLLDKMDLVFVSINYRLGPFGFITMDDDIIPGNNGLKDQAFALKWVQNNIKQFSGDPSKVALIGMSAGGASVNLHFLSNQTKNHFSKGISISGVATNPWALMEEGKSKTIQLAKSLGCETNDSLTLLKCLHNKSDYKILTKVKELYMPWFYNPFTPFGPTVEVAGNNPFLHENPYKLHLDGKSKDAPWLVSITSEEGLYPGAEFIDNNKIQDLNQNWYNIAPHLLDFNFTVPLNKQNITSKLIREYYFGKRDIDTNSSKQLIELLSDRLFLIDIGKTAKLQAVSSNSNVFMYRFSFQGTHSISSALSKYKKYYGVSHGDDLSYLLSCYFKLETKDEIEMKDKMVEILTNFIKHGKPEISKNVLWLPISKSKDSDKIEYLDIKSSQEINMVKDNNLGNSSFWDSLPLRENSFLYTR